MLVPLRSSGSGDADQFGEGDGCAAVADVVGQFGGFADRAAYQQEVLIGAGVDE